MSAVTLPPVGIPAVDAAIAQGMGALTVLVPLVQSWTASDQHQPGTSEHAAAQARRECGAQLFRALGGIGLGAERDVALERREKARGQRTQQLQNELNNHFEHVDETSCVLRDISVALGAAEDAGSDAALSIIRLCAARALDHMTVLEDDQALRRQRITELLDPPSPTEARADGPAPS